MDPAQQEGTFRRAVVRRAPLVPAAVAMATGILAGRYLPVPLGVWGVAAIAAFLAAAATVGRAHLRAISIGAIGGAVFCASAVAGALAYHRIPASHIVTFSDRGSVLATIRGEILSTPRVQRSPTAFWLPPRTTFLLDAAAVRGGDGQWRQAQGAVAVTLGEPVYDLAAGDEVKLVGSLRRLRAPGNPGQYDWKAAQRYRGVLAGFSAPGADGVCRVASRGGDPLAGVLRKARALARRHIAGCGRPDDAVLLEALVLGERDPALRSLNRIMVEAGVAHFLSISGLHLGIFLGFIYWLLRLLMFPPRRAAAAVLVVLAAYVLLAEPRAPLLRGAVMAAAFCVAAISGRGVTTANALAAAAILILLADPLQLFTPGFQLSFGIVCGIVVLARPLRRGLFGRYLRRRGLIVFRSTRGRQRFRRWLHYRGADWLIRLVCLSLAAYVSAAPLVAYHFGLFTPYAPLLSVLLLPLMTLVLIPAYVSMALAWPMPNLAAAVGDLAGAAAGAMRQAVLLLRHLPGLSLEPFSLPVWFVPACYVAIGLWVLSRRHPRALLAAAAATAGVLAVLVVTQRVAPTRPYGQFHVLDVGHGSMAALYCPNGKTYLFDAGTAGRMDAFHQVLRPFLRAKRLPGPEAVFISHANLDHYNALPDLLERRAPRRVYLNEFFGRREDSSPLVRELMDLLGKHNVEVVRLSRGQKVQLGPKTRVEVLWPPAAAESPELDINDSSLVLRVVCGNRSVLIPGDAGQLVEERLSELPADQVGSDVLVLPHHGSSTPTLGSFIQAVGAKVLLQSSEFRRDPPQLQRALAGRSRYATFRDGWIGLDLSAKAIRVQTMHPR